MLFRFVQSPEQSGRRKRRGPDHGCGVDDDAPCEAGQSEAEHLGREDVQNAECWAEILLAVPVLGGRHGDETARGVCAAAREIDAQGYEAVLLDVPWTGVETEREATVAELPVRQGARPHLAKGMDQDLRDRVPDGQARL